MISHAGIDYNSIFVAASLMNDPIESLILDLLQWLGPKPRPYREVIEVWRTSCPRLPVWEEATDRGLVQQNHAAGAETMVTLSPAGVQYLAEHRP